MSSLMYSPPQLKSADSDWRKGHVDFLDSSNVFHQNHGSNGLMRYRSVPSSALLDLVDSSVEDFRSFRYPRPSSPEVDTPLSRLISSCNASDGDNGSSDHSSANLAFQERRVKQEEARDSASKQEEAGDSASKQNRYSNSHRMVYQTQQDNNNNNASSFGAFKSNGLENSMQQAKAGGNQSNLARQSSSPPGFFCNLNVDNGFNLMKDASSFRVSSNGTIGEASPSTSRMSIQFGLPRIAENGIGNTGDGSEQDQGLGNAANGAFQDYISDFPNNTWEIAAFQDLKRGRDNYRNKFSTTSMDTQNVDFGQRSHGLAHHMTFPAHFEMPGAEKLIHFQDSVPCRIRAKRGFATHPRSIAERKRRTRISERIRKLQDLFPNMDKQTSTAEMLELAVEYIKDLQKEVKTLKDTKAKCSCPSYQKHN